MGVEQQLQPIVSKIVGSFRPKKIILFGSYAWGQPSKNSDVDLLIIKGGSKKNTREMAIELEQILSQRALPLDLLVYKPEQVEKRLSVNDSFMSKIINKGIVLYAN